MTTTFPPSFFARQLASGAADANATTSPQPKSYMQRYVLPSSRERFLAAARRGYMPEQIEGILRSAVTGDLTNQHQLFSHMLATWPRLQRAIIELRDAVTDHDWPIQPYCAPGKKPTPEALRRRQIIHEVFWGINGDPTTDENGTEEFLNDLTDAWATGMSVQEINWEQRDSSVGKIAGIKSARWLHPKNYGYPSSQTLHDQLMLRLPELAIDNPNLIGQIDELVSRGLVKREGDWATFPPDKFLVAIAKHKSGHPVGGALLQSLAWLWCVANLSLEWMAEKGQVFGVPLRMAYYPSGSDDQQIAKVSDMMENLGAAGWGVFEEGTKIDIQEAVTNAQGDPIDKLQMAADMACDLLILGNAVTSGQTGQKSRDLSTERMDEKSQRKRGVLNWTAARINRQLIPMIMRLNFGGDLTEMPFVTTGDEAEKDGKAVAETVGQWVKNGLKVPVSWAHEKAGIPEPEEGEMVLEVSSDQVSGDQGNKPGARNQKLGARTEPAAAAGAAYQQAIALAARSPYLAQAAASTQDRVYAEHVAANIPGVQKEWLKNVKPFLLQLVMTAQNPNVSEDQLRSMIERLRQNLPMQIGRLLNDQALMTAMENAMGAAMVNGLSAGMTERKEI